VESQAEGTPCIWETEQEMAGENLMVLERAKIDPILVVYGEYKQNKIPKNLGSNKITYSGNFFRCPVFIEKL
jgi:hypothetical protein